jgi:alkanesulfonate monooxygenase SsuD/methylene tetrahydromethanopterin reductase-like flavin-dependent oxidoreductase (luciferase family)
MAERNFTTCVAKRSQDRPSDSPAGLGLHPRTTYAPVAAKALATLSNLGQGRVVLHLIAGGSDADQAAEGDFLDKNAR